MFVEAISVNERILIIKTSTLADATILDANYKQLIRDASNEELQTEFRTLRKNTLTRIQELTN